MGSVDEETRRDGIVVAIAPGGPVLDPGGTLWAIEVVGISQFDLGFETVHAELPLSAAGAVVALHVPATVPEGEEVGFDHAFDSVVGECGGPTFGDCIHQDPEGGLLGESGNRRHVSVVGMPPQLPERVLVR
jgi:hypothetical protein